ncbi:hypothetical protein P7K49_023420 [Saguinus oedipus]|uniref:Uncharacterized protein n=1 Tax=Saguinus oedipus TaxID=9490 RepID=A0ABQ9ULP6_SAGOE|nr:hypothetical protein P7K49_023420 [Saguinus oedipus]
MQISRKLTSLSPAVELVPAKEVQEVNELHQLSKIVSLLEGTGLSYKSQGSEESKSQKENLYLASSSAIPTPELPLELGILLMLQVLQGSTTVFVGARQIAAASKPLLHRGNSMKEILSPVEDGKSENQRGKFPCHGERAMLGCLLSCCPKCECMYQLYTDLPCNASLPGARVEPGLQGASAPIQIAFAYCRTGSFSANPKGCSRGLMGKVVSRLGLTWEAVPGLQGSARSSRANATR